MFFHRGYGVSTNCCNYRMVISQQHSTKTLTGLQNKTKHPTTENKRITEIVGSHEIIFELKSSKIQRWADCEIFQSEFSPDPIKLNSIQFWSAQFLKITSPIQSWSANVKPCIFIFPCEAKNYWSYFTFNQIWLVESKIVPVVLLLHEAN